MKQFQTAELSILREAVNHAEKEVPTVAIGKNEQGDAFVGSVAEELLLGSDIQNAASLGFDKKPAGGRDTAARSPHVPDLQDTRA